MYCPNCGTPNDDNGTFCTSCGSAFRNLEAPRQDFAQAPPMRAPTQQSANQQPITIDAKPYKTEFVLSLIGSIIGSIIFIILLSTGIDELSYSTYDGWIIIAGSVFVLASFVLGFIGMALFQKGQGSGGILCVIGGALGFIAIFFGYVGTTTMLYFPLILAAGIVALARRKIVERDFPQI